MIGRNTVSSDRFAIPLPESLITTIQYTIFCDLRKNKVLVLTQIILLNVCLLPRVDLLFTTNMSCLWHNTKADVHAKTEPLSSKRMTKNVTSMIQLPGAFHISS